MARQATNFANSPGSMNPSNGANGPGRSGGVSTAPGSAAQGAPGRAGPEAVRKRAYEIYLSRAAKGQPGNEMSDWAQAERELNGKR